MKELGVTLSEGRLDIKADAYTFMDLQNAIKKLLSGAANGQGNSIDIRVQGNDQLTDINLTVAG